MESEDQPGPFPPTSSCWNCGRIVGGSTAFPQRSCKHCQVRWHELLPGQAVTHRDDREGVHLLLSGKGWPLRRHAEYADQFDQLIDHAEANISCPA